MLSDMPKSVFNGLAALTVAIPILAWSNMPPVHNVRSSALTYFYESDNIQNQNTDHTVTGGFATFSWQEGRLQGFGHLRTKVGNGDWFELRLVRVTATDSISVNGEWDVYKNGNPTCAGCKGAFFVMSVPDMPDYVKGYVNGDKVGYSFIGDLDPNTRFDY